MMFMNKVELMSRMEVIHGNRNLNSLNEFHDDNKVVFLFGIIVEYQPASW